MEKVPDMSQEPNPLSQPHEPPVSKERKKIDTNAIRDGARMKYEAILELAREQAPRGKQDQVSQLVEAYEEALDDFLQAVQKYDAGVSSNQKLNDKIADFNRETEEIYDDIKKLFPEDTPDTPDTPTIAYDGESHHPVPATLEDNLQGYKVREQKRAGRFDANGVNVLPANQEPISMVDRASQAVPDTPDTPSLEPVSEPARQGTPATPAIEPDESEETSFPREILYEDDTAEMSSFPREILNDADAVRPTSPVSPVVPAPGSGTPTPPTPPGTPATPKKTKEDIEKEIADLQEKLGPMSVALYAARAEAERKVIEGRKGIGGWFKKKLSKGGFGGAVDPEEFDAASTTAIQQAEENYNALASQLEQKLDERVEQKIAGLSDIEITTRIVRQRERQTNRDAEFGDVKRKDGTVVERQKEIKVTPEDIAAYRAKIEKKLPALKASARFQGVYLKQAAVDRKTYVESLPPQERAKFIEYMSKAGKFMKKTRHARIVGLAAVGALTGGVGYAGAAAIFGARIARSYIGLAVGGAVGATAGSMYGKRGERKIKEATEGHTKKEIEALRGNTEEAKRQAAAQKIVEEEERAQKRLVVKQAGVAAAAGFVAGAGAAGAVKMVEDGFVSGVVDTANKVVHAPNLDSARSVLRQAAGLEPSGEDNMLIIKKGIEDLKGRAPETPTGAPTSAGGTTTKPDPRYLDQHDASAEELAARHAKLRMVHEGPEDLRPPKIPPYDKAVEDLGDLKTPEAQKIILEGQYEKGSSITQVIDNELKDRYPNLTDTQRARVAYRLALSEGDEPGFKAQRGNINLVHEGDHYKAELDAAKVQAEIDRVLGGKGAPAPAHAPEPATESHAVRPTGGKPHGWEPPSRVGSIDGKTPTQIGNLFGMDAQFWNVLRGQRIGDLHDMVYDSDPTRLEEFAASKGVSSQAVREMVVGKIDALAKMKGVKILPGETPEEFLRRVGGTAADKPVKTMDWFDRKSTEPSPAVKSALMDAGRDNPVPEPPAVAQEPPAPAPVAEQPDPPARPVASSRTELEAIKEETKIVRARANLEKAQERLEDNRIRRMYGGGRRWPLDNRHRVHVQQRLVIGGSIGGHFGRH